jgi:FkbM family methyltransferase
MIQSKDFGYYAPNPRQKLILGLVKTGFGRGRLKSYFQKKFISESERSSPVDICYHNLKLRLIPGTNITDDRILFSSKLREKRELLHLKQAIKQGQKTFIDIGANVGYYALNAAKFGANKVIAIEPNPATYDRLRQNISLNNFQNIITPLQVGLGAEPGSMTLHVIEDSLGGSSMKAGNGKATKQVNVEILPLTTMLADQAITKADIIKIDIEGLEDKVLFPYFKSIKDDQYPSMIIIEDNSDEWDDNILQWLLDNGYKIAEETRGNFILKLK